MLDLLHRWRSDEALMLAYQKGDMAAFEQLYGRHKDGLFSFLYHQYPDLGAVEELAQEAWVAVVDAAGRYQAKASFKTWLYQIGRHKLADHWRRHQHRMASEGQSPDCVSLNQNPEHSAVEQRLLEAIGQLPREQKDALLLLEQGFSHREIGEITDCGEETVKSRLRYGRKQLRQQLGEEL